MRTPLILAALAAAAPLANAATETQTVNFSHGFDGEIVTFQKFDTMGGTRQLTGLTLSYDQQIDIGFHVESNGYTDLAAGDWETSIAYNSLHQMGLVDNDPNPPFIGPGAAFEGGITADLAASDGYNGTGADTYTGSVNSGPFNVTYDYDSSTPFGIDMLDTFTGSGDLDTFFSGFSEIFGGFINDPGWIVDPNNPPEGPFMPPFEQPYYGFFVTLDTLTHAGTITVSYDYEIVPAPASVGLLALGGLVATRRRR